MEKHFNKSHSLIIVLILILLTPGIALAGSSRHSSAQAVTGTITPTITSTPQVQRTPPSATDFFTSQIPGMPQMDTPIIQFPDTTETFTFGDFGLDEITLRGPFATAGYYYDLPMTWKMKPDAVLRFALDVFYTDAFTDTQRNVTSAYGGTLLVQYNYTTIGAIDLNREGRYEVDLPISVDILNQLGSNKNQSIQLILDSGINCDVNFRTTVVVRTDSQLFLPHILIDPPIDLRALPSPFYQNSFNQDVALVVLPEQPSTAELQSALSVVAGFGRMTFGRLLISVAPINKIPPDILASANLIFVGKANSLPILKNAHLPAPILNGAFSVKEAVAGSGIIQSAVSPWNKTKVIMVVGGNDDAGVTNAGRALSTGTLQVGVDSALSVVSDVQLIVPQFNPTDVNQTLDDLGYESAVVNEIGLNTVEYLFNIPPSYILGPDAYLDLNFAHSSLLEYQRSTIIVKLNEQPIGSVRLSDETMGQGNAKIVLPASAARPGINSLRLDINLEPLNECVNPIIEGLWMRIDSSSSLHLPFVPNPASPSLQVDLAKYPSPFAFDPLMKDLAFVLAKDDPTGWYVAAQLAFELGYTNGVEIAGVEVYYADAVPETARQERNLIIIGKPSKLALLDELTSVLPAPFEPGSDLAVEKNLQVEYHLGEGADVGYLELLPAPWNSNRMLLYVGGSSDLGVRWAGATLQFGRFRSKLSGNLAFINGEQIVSADTRVLQGLQGTLATAAPADATPVSIQLQPITAEHPAWILPAIFTALGGVVLVFLILGIQVLYRRRSGK
ncbi:MAG: cellulose biosynthesis cyclic di-GMP-binding regulatory protein BcsB [Chloroflexi bacterium]|nr:cellulose biosynthesis cyclic di-GMP-binding regulatory protein BcsB [Chloroflexota bacterium]